MKSLVLYLLFWITSYGGSPELSFWNPEDYGVPNGPVFLDTTELTTVCSHGTASGEDYSVNIFYGCYIPENKTIYMYSGLRILPEGMPETVTMYGQVVLIHELVHFIQNTYYQPLGKISVDTNDLVTIMPNLEAQAYYVGARYQAYIGGICVSPEEE